MPPIVNRETLQSCLEKYFGEIPDPRVERTRAHQLLDIIAIALFAVLSGADSWVAIETYGNAKQGWLESFLALPNGIPSHDTFARVFARLDPQAFEAIFLKSRLTPSHSHPLKALGNQPLAGAFHHARASRGPSFLNCRYCR